MDDRILVTIEQESPNYHQVFPVGQPVKSLYAVYAIQEYLSIQFSMAKSNNEHGSYNNAMAHALRLVVWAISNREVADQNSSQELRIRLASKLVEQLLSILKGVSARISFTVAWLTAIDPSRASSVPDCLSITLLERLVEIMSFCTTAHPTATCTTLLTVTFQAILDTCSLRVELWNELCSRADVKPVIRKILLDDPRDTLRKSTALAIGEKTVHLLRYGCLVLKL